MIVERSSVRSTYFSRFVNDDSHGTFANGRQNSNGYFRRHLVIIVA